MTRLFVSDLDQTFLDDKRHFNKPRFEALLDDLAASGDQFAIATGRDEKWVKNKFGKLADRVHLVTGNGATWRVNGSETLHERNIDMTVLPQLETLLLQPEFSAIRVIAFSANNMYQLSGLDDEKDGIKADVTQTYPNIIVVDHLADIKEPLVSVTGAFSSANAQAVIDVVDNDHLPLHVTTSGYGTVDILAAGVNKATSLAKLIRQIDIKPADLLVFGDGMNDLEMMQLAGQTYIMPNSDERLFGRGYHVVANDNNHDGVLAEIEKIIA